MNAPDIAIVMAAGEGSRWGDYLGVPKHLVEVGGVGMPDPILHRTVRLLRRHVPEVWVVARDDERYRRHGGHTLTVQPLDSDMDKFWSSRRLWHGRNALLVYGDCYFTEEAIAAMVQPFTQWTLYCRPHASELTGAEYGECWGYAVSPTSQRWFADRITWLAGAHTLGGLGRVGGWELYRAMCRQDPTVHQMFDHYYEINDWTEDFDYPHDYDLWQQRFNGRADQ